KRTAGPTPGAAAMPPATAAPATPPSAPRRAPSPVASGCSRGLGAAPPHWPQHPPAPWSSPFIEGSSLKSRLLTHDRLAEQRHEQHVRLHHVIHQPLAQEGGDLAALRLDALHSAVRVLERGMDALREDVDLGQQHAVLALVLVEMEVAVGDLDALLALEVVFGVAPQFGQRQVDVARVVREAQHELYRVDEQDQVAVIGVDLLVADAELRSPEDGHGSLGSRSGAWKRGRLDCRRCGGRGHHPPASRPPPRRNTRLRLLAGMSTTSSTTKPRRCASASTASRSRTEKRASMLRSHWSKSALLGAVWAPPRR